MFGDTLSFLCLETILIPSDWPIFSIYWRLYLFFTGSHFRAGLDLSNAGKERFSILFSPLFCKNKIFLSNEIMTFRMF